jgi:2-polyprenyl-3-methyl-5-hydroxy-6-metoxy-1,4-benzoquinol methylase
MQNMSTKEEGKWEKFKNELITIDPDLSFFPQRLFAFEGSIEILLDQNINDVGHIIWDAEVLLAHYLEWLEIADKSVLELGAGSGLAAILCGKMGARQVSVQELPTVIDHTKSCFDMNFICASFVSDTWGAGCIEKLKAVSHGFDVIIMADVLYHPEHFEDLALTITSCLLSKGSIIASYEQRRRDISHFFTFLISSGLFSEAYKISEYSIPRSIDGQSEQCVHFYIHHLLRKD